MPYLRIELTVGLPPEARRDLLQRSAEVFAEITESPLDRVRTVLVEVPTDRFAVGGVPIGDSGVQAPFVTIHVLAGRPAEQHQALIERVSAVVAETVDVPIGRVRLLVVEVPPALWGIGGVPAATRRRDEIEARLTT
jgi:4-oxalocrotonate tautomerase